MPKEFQEVLSWSEVERHLGWAWFLWLPLCWIGETSLAPLL